MKYYIKNFCGKLISTLRVDENDSIFVEISKRVVWSEDYFPGELIYMGQWQDRPTEEIAAFINDLNAQFMRNWKMNFMAKRRGHKLPPPSKWNDMVERKQASVAIPIAKIHEFCYGDLLFLGKRLQTSPENLKDCTRRICADLEKYPAGFAKWLIGGFMDKIHNLKQEIGKNMEEANDSFFYYLTQQEIKAIKIEDEVKEKIWNDLIKEAPKQIKKLKWLSKEVTYGSDRINMINTQSKWDFYCSLSLPGLKWSHVKWTMKRQNNKLSYKLGDFKSIGHQINDYIDWYSRLHNNGILIDLTTKVVQDSFYWHAKGCPGREDVGNAVMPKNPKVPESLEQYRIKTAKQMQELGVECGHCIGTKWRSNNQFFVWNNNDRSSVVCAEVDMDNDEPYIVQCYDRHNKVTPESKEFMNLIKKELNCNTSDGIRF